MFPARSATATTMGAFTDITAFCTTVVTSVISSGVAAAGGGSGEFKEEDPLPLQDRHSITAAHIIKETPERPKRSCFLDLIFIAPARREDFRLFHAVHYAWAGDKVKLRLLPVSKLVRNVPIVNSLEVSPFWGLMFSLACALERSPAVRAKRKCAGQRAARRGRNPGSLAAGSDSPAARGGWVSVSLPPSRAPRVQSAPGISGVALAVR